MTRASAAASVRRTLASELRFAGVGLHSGEECAVRVGPSRDARCGFWVEDVRQPGPSAPLDWRGVVAGEPRRTVWSQGNLRLQTVEHLLAALAGAHIHDAVVCVEKGAEVPILDGSAREMRDRLGEAAVDTDVPLRVLRVKQPVAIEMPAPGLSTVVELRPLDSLDAANGVVQRVSVDVQFDPWLPRQRFSATLDDFPACVAAARTFCSEEELAALRKADLIKGGSLDNAVVYTRTGQLNPGGLRFPDEAARHKALDVFGDLALAGPLQLYGHYVGVRPGHAATRALLKKLFESEGAVVEQVRV